MDQLFGPGGMDLNAPLHPGSSAFNKFLSQHKLAMAEDNGKREWSNELRVDNRRFAGSTSKCLCDGNIRKDDTAGGEPIPKAREAQPNVALRAE